jgi:hypothetical protein
MASSLVGSPSHDPTPPGPPQVPAGVGHVEIASAEFLPKKRLQSISECGYVADISASLL